MSAGRHQRMEEQRRSKRRVRRCSKSQRLPPHHNSFNNVDGAKTKFALQGPHPTAVIEIRVRFWGALSLIAALNSSKARSKSPLRMKMIPRIIVRRGEFRDSLRSFAQSVPGAVGAKSVCFCWLQGLYLSLKN